MVAAALILPGNSSAPRRKTMKMKVPSFCLGDWSYVDVQEYLKHSTRS